MARIKKLFEQMIARFPEGTFERIAAVLKPHEDRATFVRAAVEREIRLRENRK